MECQPFAATEKSAFLDLRKGPPKQKWVPVFRGIGLRVLPNGLAGMGPTTFLKRRSFNGMTG